MKHSSLKCRKEILAVFQLPSIKMAESKDRDAHDHRHNHQLQEQQTFMIHQQHQVPQYPTTTTTTVLEQTTTVVSAPQVVVGVSVGRPVYATGYSRITSVSLGGLHIGMCVMSIICGIVAIDAEASGSQNGSGFWCGIIYGVVGSVAVAAGVKPSNDLIIGATVLSSVAFVFGITQLILAVVSLVSTVYCSSGANICVVEGSASGVISTAAMGTYGFWEILFGLCLFLVGVRAICCPPKSQTLVVPPPPPPPPPPVTVPLTSAIVWNHSSPPGPSNSAFDYEEFRLEEEGATASARYEPLHTKFTV